MRHDQVPKVFPFTAWQYGTDQMPEQVQVLAYVLAPGASVMTLVAQGADGKKFSCSVDYLQLTKEEVEESIRQDLQYEMQSMVQQISECEAAIQNIKAHPLFVAKTKTKVAKPEVMPDINKIADAFCLIVADWGYRYRPERMEPMYRGEEYAFDSGTEARVHPDDVCDGNMAMHAAICMALGVDPDDDGVEFVGGTEDSSLPQWFMDLFNAAYDVARQNGWFPSAALEGEGPRYMCVWGLGYSSPAEVKPIENFCEDLGYPVENIEHVKGLNVGDCANLSDVNEHYVWRIR